MRDLYEVLEVQRNATQDEIKKSYRRLAKKYHPDLNKDSEENDARVKEINEAYSILGDEEKRKKYDTYGSAAFEQGGFSGGAGGFGDIFGDLFSDFFGGGFQSSAGTRANVRRRGADIKQRLRLTFKEAVFGTEREVTVRQQVSCEKCDGSGVMPGSSKEICPTCHGSGQVRHQQNSMFGQFIHTSTCSTCGGTGEIIKEKCDQCNGMGVETKAKKIKVTIPAGVDSDSVISVRGEGHSGENGGPSGDLFLILTVEPHEVFRRDGYNIHFDLPISFAQAALGAEVEVPTLTGTTDFTIPAGTQSGTVFQLKGEGIQHVNSDKKGNIYFRANVHTPTSLNDKQKAKLREFAEMSGEQVTETKKNFFDKLKDLFD